ncbi:MAG: hypothetical protein E7672_09365, partial [Ruminococcaceae bacterium]|nr:hypothetical protein [Oscillospiraceae bacterium]
MRSLVLDPLKLPIKFDLGGVTYTGMPSDCKTVRENGKIIYVSMIGDVEVKAECVVYDDYDASEWTVYFTNKGNKNSPALTNAYAIYNVFKGENNRIYTCNGDFASPDGYSTTETHLSEGGELRQTSRGGKSCDKVFPYQRLLFDGYGHNIAIGWPSQWEFKFKATSDGVEYWAAQEENRDFFNIEILPGETIRTPLVVVVSFEGDLERGINVWRRWYLKYVGTAKPYIQGEYTEPGTLCFTHSNAKDNIEHIRKAIENGIDVNMWWIDAGWYPSKTKDGEDSWWDTVGIWEPDKERYPNGLAEVALECEKYGIDFLVWFEPERVGAVDSYVEREHPEWLLIDPAKPHVKMLNLGDKDCCDYLIKTIGDVIEDGHIKIYRQDCNFQPLTLWRTNDTENRRGARENLYAQGYLRFWDGLLERFPGLLIDSCAAGGRRNDIETMRRSVPIHSTDYGYGNYPIQQSFMQTMYSWIPYFRSYAESWERTDGEYGKSSHDGEMMQLKHDDEFMVLA